MNRPEPGPPPTVLPGHINFWRRLPATALVGGVDVVLFSEVISGDRAASGATAAVVAYGMVAIALLTYSNRWPVPVFVALCGHSAVGPLVLNYRPVLPVCAGLLVVVAVRGGCTAVAAWALAEATSLSWMVDNVTGDAVSASEVVLAALGYQVVLTVAGGIGLWQRVSTRRLRALELEHAQNAVRAVAVERRRMARELHDIVAHALTVMTLQAAGARRVMPSDVELAYVALDAVERCGAQAMAELRGLLGVLRSGAGVAIGAEPAPAGVHRGVADLEALVEQVRAAGVEVEVTERGCRGQLDPSVDLALYRVVQEALTNVSKHVGFGARSSVDLAWSPTSLQVRVCDDGRGKRATAAAQRSGHGLAGLLERVTTVGGSLSAEPLSGGGFVVTATLPSRSSPASPASPASPMSPASQASQAPPAASPVRPSPVAVSVEPP